MPIIIKLQDIDEAIENLRYKSETTLKARLLRAVRQYYTNDMEEDSLPSIDTEDLVRTIWETGDDHDLLKAKRKNFSSLKSSVNSDLKKLYAEGKNPQGIVIGHNNVFGISDEAKDKALAGIMDVFREKGIDTQSKISEILSVLSDILSTSLSETEVENTKEEIDRLKNILGGITGKLGLSLHDIVRRAGTLSGPGAPLSGPGIQPMELPVKDKDLSGYIRGGLSEIDQGLQGLVREIEEASGAAQTGVIESVRGALKDIVGVLRDSKGDIQGRAKRIMVSVTNILTDTIDASGNELTGDQAGQLKQIFREMTQGAEDALADGGRLEAFQAATPAELKGGGLLAMISSVLGDGELSAAEKIGKIISTVNGVVDDALAHSGISDDEIAGIKGILANITDNLESLPGESPTGEECIGTEGSMRAALQDIVQTLEDTGTDTADKAKKIMTAIEGVVADAIETAGGALSRDQAGQLKQIFHEMAEGAGNAPAEAFQVTPPAELAGSELHALVSSILDDGELSTAEKIGKIISAINGVVDDALAHSGISDEEIAGIKSILATITGNLESLAGKDGTGTSENTENSMRMAVRSIVQTLEDTGTDTADKAKKIMAAIEDVVNDAIETTGSALSGDQAGQLKQIFREMNHGAGDAPADGGRLEAFQAATPAELKGGGLLAMISSVLGDGELSAAEKIGKIMAAVNDLVGDALAHSGISDDEIAGIKSTLTNISGNLETLAGESLTGTEETGTEDAIRKALRDIVQTLRDSGLDTAGKAKKIMADVLGMLTCQIDASATLSDDQAGQLKQIIDEMVQGAEEATAEEQEENGKMPTPAGLAGSELLAAVSAILGDGELSAADHPCGWQGKISKIMAAVNDLIGETLACGGTELSEEEIAGIKDMMANVTDNLDAFAEEAIEGFEIIEEIALPPEGAELPPEGMIEDVAGEQAQLAESMEGSVGEAAVVDDAGTQFAEIVEIVEDVSGGALESAADIEMAADEMITDQAAISDLLEDMVDVASAEEAAMIDVEPGSLTGTETIEEIAVPPEEAIASLSEVIDASTGEAIDALSGSGLDIQGAEGEDIPGGSGASDLSLEAAEDTGTSANDLVFTAATDEIISAELAQTELIEELSSSPAGVMESGEIESIEFVEETALSPEGVAHGVASDAEVVAGLAEDEGTEWVEDESLATDGVEEILSETATVESQSVAEAADIETIENIGEEDFVEEIVEDVEDTAAGIQVTPANSDIDSDLREKEELLTRLAEAAGALQALGPDLSGSVFTEEEIRGKAKFLSEEFDRYLSIRDKFYNAHILIRGGDYLVGGAHLAKSVLAEQIATLPDFYIGKFPVTNALFEIFIEQTGYVTTAEKVGYSLVYFPRMQRSRDPITGAERFSLHNQAYSKKVAGACWHRPMGPDSSLHLKRTHPVVQVSLEDAHAFAVWTGKRLPTEIEWEAAARTQRGLDYPWGNEWQENACNIENSLHGDTTPVDLYVKFANAFEVADTLGNVLEWTGDVVGDPETSETCIAKGASWVAHDEISLTDRHYIEKNASSNILGFRCVAI